MKKIKYLFLSLLTVAGFTSCQEDLADTLTTSNDAGGLLENITTSITYAQGSPATDLLNAKFSAFQGREKIESVSIYKQYFGKVSGVDKVSNRSLLKTLTFPLANQYETLNYSFNYNDLISGLIYNGTPMPTSDATLQIGDFWEITYEAKLVGGGIVHLNAKKTKVTVACGSFLEKHYSNRTVRVSTGVVYTFADDNVRKVGDGQYLTSYIGPYYCGGQTPGTSGNTIQLPAGTNAGFVFNDVCSTIGVDTQNLATVFSNEVRQSPAQKANSKVDLVTGKITIYYSIFFSGNTVEREFITTLTPL